MICFDKIKFRHSSDIKPLLWKVEPNVGPFIRPWYFGRFFFSSQEENLLQAGSLATVLMHLEWVDEFTSQ